MTHIERCSPARPTSGSRSGAGLGEREREPPRMATGLGGRGDVLRAIGCAPRRPRVPPIAIGGMSRRPRGASDRDRGHDSASEWPPIAEGWRLGGRGGHPIAIGSIPGLPRRHLAARDAPARASPACLLPTVVHDIAGQQTPWRCSRHSPSTTLRLAVHSSFLTAPLLQLARSNMQITMPLCVARDRKAIHVHAAPRASSF